jgi:orotidine-5'-phosphate decarboxylase
MFKINTHLFTAEGPRAVEKLTALGPGVFLDLKFHDIPTVIAGAVRSALSLSGVRIVNMHALAGAEGMKAAADQAAKGGPRRAKVIAVTILTSHSEASIRRVGIAGPVQREVRRLAQLARQAGLDGVVASPHEVKTIRRVCGPRFLIVVPGVRPAAGSSPSRKDDQSRTATPAATIRAGADYLVVGRPITAVPDPVAAARAILEEIASALP